MWPLMLATIVFFFFVFVLFQIELSCFNIENFCYLFYRKINVTFSKRLLSKKNINEFLVECQRWLIYSWRCILIENFASYISAIESTFRMYECAEGWSPSSPVRGVTRPILRRPINQYGSMVYYRKLLRALSGHTTGPLTRVMSETTASQDPATNKGRSDNKSDRI